MPSRYDVHENQVCVPYEAGMMFRHGLSRLAFRMDPGDLHLRMMHQKADQFAGGVAGAPDNPCANHYSPG